MSKTSKFYRLAHGRIGKPSLWMDGVMQRKPFSQAQLVEQLIHLGVNPGGVLLVHCGFSQVRPVENGPSGLIQALQAALGPQGTLVMPSMSDDDAHPFDPRKRPCAGMGVVANTFRQLPDVLRSDSPPAFERRACGRAACIRNKRSS